LARFKTKTHTTLEAVLDDPNATPADKVKAAELLEKYKTQRTNYRRHTKAKELLGIGGKESKQSAAARIAEEVPDHLKGTAFARDIWPTWEKEKREVWLKVWALEK
jgi:hypothetical protein